MVLGTRKKKYMKQKQKVLFNYDSIKINKEKNKIKLYTMLSNYLHYVKTLHYVKYLFYFILKLIDHKHIAVWVYANILSNAR